MSALFVYVTVPSLPEAHEIASAVVESRLAACANIIPGMKSVYRWKGRIEERDEITLILKTVERKLGALEARIRQMHSDETPCIVALPVTGGNAAFIGWIKEETT